MAIMRQGEPDRARAAAAEVLLARGWGHPSHALELTPKIDLSALTDEELAYLERLGERLNVATPPS